MKPNFCAVDNTRSTPYEMTGNLFPIEAIEMFDFFDWGARRDECHLHPRATSGPPPLIPVHDHVLVVPVTIANKARRAADDSIHNTELPIPNGVGRSDTM